MNNNLRNLICYSVGAIDRVEGYGRAWREELNVWLKTMRVQHIDPHHKPFKVPQESDSMREEVVALKKAGNFAVAKERFGIIRSVDLRCVDLSSFLIARIDPDVHMCGTYEEITTANRQKKPILCHIVGGTQHTPSWLVYMLPEWSFFNTMDEIKAHLMHIDEIDPKYADPRWIFWADDVFRKEEIIYNLCKEFMEYWSSDDKSAFKDRIQMSNFIETLEEEFND